MSPFSLQKWTVECPHDLGARPLIVLRTKRCFFGYETRVQKRTATSEFNALGLYAAMDARRTERGLSWRQVAAEIRDQSSVLNDHRGDHPISASTLTGIAKRGDCTCQHALFILRWLGRSPESFLSAPPIRGDAAALPAA
jgi:hypothetical protein